MHIVDPKIHEYLLKTTPEREPVLKKMEELAHAEDFPMVGPLVGRFLYQIVQMMKAKRIFEMGSGFGYSAYWMALALDEGGEIICTDSSLRNKKAALKFFSEGGMISKLRYKVGDAVAALKEEPGPFDVIFNDIDKEAYPEVPDLALSKLRKGGLLITDNLLWDGKVTMDDPDESTAAILRYTERVCDQKEFFTTIIPLRDGVSVSMKL